MFWRDKNTNKVNRRLTTARAIPTSINPEPGRGNHEAIAAIAKSPPQLSSMVITYVTSPDVWKMVHGSRSSSWLARRALASKHPGEGRAKRIGDRSSDRGCQYETRGVLGADRSEMLT